MEKSVSRLLTIEIIREAMRLFGAAPDACRLISDVENFVYECSRKDGPFILRITHSSHRGLNQILGELDWMRYLSDHDVVVAQPIPSGQGKFVENIDLGDSSFYVTAFEKIVGENIIDSNACTPEMYQRWGRTMGRMHQLAKTYLPKEPAIRRAGWSEDDILAHITQYLKGQTQVLGKIQAMLAWMAGLHQDTDSYGLIHADLTDVNYFVNDGRITVFDFDDCIYHWFVYDIAVVLYENLEWLPQLGMDRDDFGSFFWKHFYAGYAVENKLDAYWLDQIPAFMKFHEMYLYGVFHKKWDLDKLTEKRKNTLQTYQFDIENDVRSLNIRFVE